MKKIDPVVLKETKYIFAFSLVLSVLMQSVFLIVGKWDYTVLAGNVLGLAASTGNFFLMGLTVQKSLSKKEDDAKSFMKLSQKMRMLMLFVVAMLGYLIPFLKTIAVIIPYVFPRIAIMLRPVFNKKEK